MPGLRKCLRLVALAVCLTAVTVVPARAQLRATLVASGFTAPVGFVQDPSDPAVQMVVEQGGHIRVLQSGVVQGADFLDISALLPAPPLNERGLLGLAFAPDYASSGRFYVSFTNVNGDSVISRYVRSANPLMADATTRLDLEWDTNQRVIAQPYPNHNGGNIAFGPDGYLYVGFGDGGSGYDPDNRAQDPGQWLGKMLRIDVSVPDSNSKGYDIPIDNPFVGQGGVRPEIWALGLRNPWRWSFDTAGAGGTGAMIIGDVGQDAWEELDYQPAGRGGRNYGWRVWEGPQMEQPSPGPWSALTAPLWYYSHSEGTSIIGGFVYRGNALGAAYRGRYFFADYVRSRFWSLTPAVDPGTQEATAGFPIEHTSDFNVPSPSSFGVDSQGEIYIVSYTGSIYRIDPPPAPPTGGCSTPDPFVNIGGGTCVGGAWHSPRKPGDFNLDSMNDVVFWNYTTGQLYAWFMNGLTFSGGSFLSLPSNAALGVGAIADFTGDGRLDMLMQDQGDGSVHLFAMNGVVSTGEQILPIAPNTPWRVVASGDLNGDGYPDIVWENFLAGQIYIWYMKPVGGVATFIGGDYLQDGSGTPIALGGPAAWRVAGTGDFNSDGRADLVWQNESTGAVKISYLTGPRIGAEGPLGSGGVNGVWKIRAVADFNNDGQPDILWEHFATCDLYAWLMAGPSLVSGTFLTPSRVNTVWIVGGPK